MIVPMVLFCVLGVFLSGVYFYDLGTARSCLNREAIQLSDTIKTEAEAETGRFSEERLQKRSSNYLLQRSYSQQAAAGERELKKKLDQKLMISRASQISFTAGQKKIVGRVRLSFSLPFPMIGEIAGKIWKNDLKATIENGNCAEQMRRWDSLE